MKSILYVGATLMIGAGIYGFVDYKQTSQKKEFNNMYAEKKVTAPEPVTVSAEPAVQKKEIAAAPVSTELKNMDKTTTATTKKTVKKVKKKKTLNSKMFSRGAMDERYLEPVKANDIKSEPVKMEKKEQ